jgi:hypothetical protein
MIEPIFLGRPHSLSETGKLEPESLPAGEVIGPYDYGVATRARAAIGFSIDGC